MLLMIRHAEKWCSPLLRDFMALTRTHLAPEGREENEENSITWEG